MRSSTPLLFALALSLPLGAQTPAEAGTHFQGQLKHRPRLAFDGRDTAHTNRVVDRLARQDQPWSRAYVHLRNVAENQQAVDHRSTGWASQPDPYGVLYGQEVRNAHIAEATAIVAWLYSQGLDPSWRPLPRLPGQASADGWVRQQAARSARTLERMFDRWPVQRGWDVLHRGIVAAESLQRGCAAFDLLAALPANLRPNLRTAETRLGNLAADMRRWHFTVKPWRNNHGIRIASALGTAAIALNRHDRYRWNRSATWWHRPSRWMRKAIRELHPTRRTSDLNYQMGTGACAEGTSYYHYSADLYLPFFFSYTRFLRGNGVPFLRSNTVTNPARWMTDLRLPDGRRPMVDNARLLNDVTPGFFGSRTRRGARSQADQAALLWDWKRNNYPGIAGRQAGWLLAAHDPSNAVVGAADALRGPRRDASLFLGEQGTAVLRTGWNPDDAYALVVAEKNRTRRRGGGHDSVDNTAYTFFARGDLITLDPGYGGWPRVTETNRGEHRSMVLVDGRAPLPVRRRAGFLDWVAGNANTHIISGPRTTRRSEIQSVEVKSRYWSAEIRRTVALVGQRWLLVEDRCRSLIPFVRRRFTSQIQTNAGTAKSRPVSVSNGRVRYETNRGRVPVCIGSTADAGTSFAQRSRVDHNGEGPEGHTQVGWTARGRKVTFLTAIATATPGGPAPDVQTVSATRGARALRVATDGRIDVVVTNPGGRRVRVRAASGTRAFTTDHELTIISFDASGGRRILWTVGRGSVRF